MMARNSTSFGSAVILCMEGSKQRLGNFVCCLSCFIKCRANVASIHCGLLAAYTLSKLQSQCKISCIIPYNRSFTSDKRLRKPMFWIVETDEPFKRLGSRSSKRTESSNLSLSDVVIKSNSTYTLHSSTSMCLLFIQEEAISP
jgi:hypothetical protein